MTTAIMPRHTDPEDAIPPSHLVEALHAANVHQAKLAKLLDMTGETVSRWKTGKTPITKARWVAILAALRLPPNWRPPHDDGLPF